MEIFPHSVCIDSKVLKAFEHAAFLYVFWIVWNNVKIMQVKTVFIKKSLLFCA